MSVSVPVPSKKVTRRTSSKDLRGVIRRQSSKDLRTGIIRRQSSRDILGGGGCSKKVTNPNQTQHKDTKLSRMISDQSSGDVCMPSLDERFTIRRDSINGLRIISKLDQSQCEALDGLADIALCSAEESPVIFSKFQTEALKTHNKYRARHGAVDLVLDPELCSRHGFMFFQKSLSFPNSQIPRMSDGTEMTNFFTNSLLKWQNFPCPPPSLFSEEYTALAPGLKNTRTVSHPPTPSSTAETLTWARTFTGAGAATLPGGVAGRSP